MQTLLLLTIILMLIYLIVRETPRVMYPREYNPGWMNMRHDGPWYGRRHFEKP